MTDIELLISKILEYKLDSSVEEVKVDLQRVVGMLYGQEQVHEGYIDYLYKHYNAEINHIRSNIINNNINNTINYNPIFSKINDMRNYLIMIAVIRICVKTGISFEINRIDTVDYCLKLFDQNNEN